MLKIKKRKYKRRILAVLTAVLLAANLFTAFTPTLMAAGLDLEKTCKLSNSELDAVRGRYAGFYFSFDFSGYWDTAGNASATLDHGGNVGDIVVGGTAPNVPSGSDLTLNAGERVVRIQAMVGSLNETRGVIQISQVPGSNNVVTTVMNLQLTVINVESAAEAARIFESLPSFMGH